MLNSTLVLIHGFARSGKTCLLNELQQRDYPIVSTSQELDWITIERHSLPRYFIDVLRRKDDQALQTYMVNEAVTCRGLKIDTAENWFVHLYGRKELIRRAFKNQLDLTQTHDFTFFETVGGEEAELVKEVANEMGFKDMISVDIRRKGELEGVDIRKLSHEYTFTNDFTTPYQLANHFIWRIEHLELNTKQIYDPSDISKMLFNPYSYINP